VYVLQIVVCPFSFGHCVVCPSIYGFFGIFKLFLNVVESGFEPQFGQTNDNKIGIWCLSAKHTALRNKSQERLSRNQDNVSEWNDMSTCGLLF
jgi:hypothetical protein